MECGCSSTGLTPISDAQALITSIISSVDEVITVRILEAVDRVLAQDIVSPFNVPAYDNSAMDGYAIRVDDLKQFESLTQVGKSFAGEPFSQVLKAGECVRIMTGAQIPEGADAVVMQENVLAENNNIKILKCSGKGEAIRPAGDDIQYGQVVLTKGTKITPVQIGVLASLGLSEVNVFRKLSVAVFSTGSELLKANEPLKPGHIYDTNRPMLVSMLQRMGFDVHDLGIIEDNKEKIRATFLEADKLADCVITSGGVSVGEADFTKEVLQEIGDIDFWKLAIKPGKPLAFGRLPNSIFFGLPGNPVSAAVTFDQLACPALSMLGGERLVEPLNIPAIAGTQFKKRPGRTDFQRAFCTLTENNELVVHSHKTQSSGVLSSFVSSNCYVVLEQERGSVAKGELVNIRLFSAPIF